MQGLANRAKGPGCIFFTGGATALMLGLREQTIDVDLKLDPEPKGIFEAIAKLKEELDINIELASPGDFIPAPDDWRARSISIESINSVQFLHYDLTLQALSKIERGHVQDLKDVQALLKNKFITAKQVAERFAEIRPLLIRYPALDPTDFAQRVSSFLEGFKK